MNTVAFETTSKRWEKRNSLLLQIIKKKKSNTTKNDQGCTWLLSGHSGNKDTGAAAAEWQPRSPLRNKF